MVGCWLWIFWIQNVNGCCWKKSIEYIIVIVFLSKIKIFRVSSYFYSYFFHFIFPLSLNQPTELSSLFIEPYTDFMWQIFYYWNGRLGLNTKLSLNEMKRAKKGNMDYLSIWFGFQGNFIKKYISFFQQIMLTPWHLIYFKRKNFDNNKLWIWD